MRLLALLYAVPSLVFKITAIALMWNFPIGAAEHKRIRDLLQQREAAAHPQ